MCARMHFLKAHALAIAALYVCSVQYTTQHSATHHITSHHQRWQSTVGSRTFTFIIVAWIGLAGGRLNDGRVKWRPRTHHQSYIGLHESHLMDLQSNRKYVEGYFCAVRLLQTNHAVCEWFIHITDSLVCVCVYSYMRPYKKIHALIDNRWWLITNRSDRMKPRATHTWYVIDFIEAHSSQHSTTLHAIKSICIREKKKKTKKLWIKRVTEFVVVIMAIWRMKNKSKADPFRCFPNVYHLNKIEMKIEKNKV